MWWLFILVSPSLSIEYMKTNQQLLDSGNLCVMRTKMHPRNDGKCCKTNVIRRYSQLLAIKYWLTTPTWIWKSNSNGLAFSFWEFISGRRKKNILKFHRDYSCLQLVRTCRQLSFTFVHINFFRFGSFVRLGPVWVYNAIAVIESHSNGYLDMSEQ